MNNFNAEELDHVFYEALGGHDEGSFMGYDLDRYEDEGEARFFEDDGSLHFRLGNGNRYCVYLGQDMSRSEFNRRVNQVCDELNVPSNLRNDLMV